MIQMLPRAHGIFLILCTVDSTILICAVMVVAFESAVLIDFINAETALPGSSYT